MWVMLRFPFGRGTVIWGRVENLGMSYDVLIGKLQTWPVHYGAHTYKGKSGALEVGSFGDDDDVVAFVIDMEEVR